jgi:fatty-acyl-CoA synthase
MTSPILSCDLLGELPRTAAQQWGERVALTAGTRSWNYVQFNDEVEALVRALRAAGVRQGERVAVWLANCPELEFLIFAVLRVGAVLVPLNTRYRAMELTHALKHSGSVMLIGRSQSGPIDCDQILTEAVGKATSGPQGSWHYEHTPALRQIVMLGDSRVPGAQPWSAWCAGATRTDAVHDLPTAQQSDVAMMMFTSGTTGKPKGVLLNHAGLRLCHDRARLMRMSQDDVQLTYLPLFHIYAIGYSVVMSFLCGASQIMMETFSGEQALRLIERHRVTVFHGFEAHFADLLAAQEHLQLDIGSLRTASFASGAESASALAARAQDALCVTCASYGLTEMWGGITISSPDATPSQRCEGSGAAQPGVELRVVDPSNGRVLGANQVGEIHVRSYTRLIAYHDDPDATREAFDSEGWFRTGDAGLLREDGHLRYLARYKDMLKVGGENVAPAEIEDLLTRIPGIGAAAVVGEAHARLQQVPVAFVVRAHTEISEAAVMAFLEGKIARFKIPRRVIFVDALPMTSTGKIQKEALRQRLQHEQGKAA